jgi:hypothetical protein
VTPSPHLPPLPPPQEAGDKDRLVRLGVDSSTVYASDTLDEGGGGGGDDASDDASDSLIGIASVEKVRRSMGGGGGVGRGVEGGRGPG